MTHCYFCQQSNRQEIDFKNTQILGKFLSASAKIKPRKKTGLCARHQKKLAQAVKRARHLALLPYTKE